MCTPGGVDGRERLLSGQSHNSRRAGQRRRGQRRPKKCAGAGQAGCGLRRGRGGVGDGVSIGGTSSGCAGMSDMREIHSCRLGTLDALRSVRVHLRTARSYLGVAFLRALLFLLSVVVMPT